MEKSIRELWTELKQNGNAITTYLSSPQELAKLLTASMAMEYPDTRNGTGTPAETPDDPINWEKIYSGIDSTEIQGIVKFKRALKDNKTITMTYLPPSEFQKKMNKYNRTGKAEDRDEALKYFTIERTPVTSSSSSSSSGGLVDVGPRDYNNDVFHLEGHIDIYKLSGNLYSKSGNYEAIQGCCFDGKNIICAINKETSGGTDNIGGKVFWFNIETNKCDSTTVDLGEEGGHMEGITYDSARKVVLCVPKNGKKDGKLIQISNETKQRMEDVTIPQDFRQLAYSVTTNQLIGFDSHHNTITFMQYNSAENAYSFQNKITLKDAHFTNIQGMSCDGQVIYLSDSRGKADMNPDNYRVWVYDFQGNKVEEHAIGDEYNRGTKEVENTFVDNTGTLWMMLPHEVAKVSNYKAHPIDWINNKSLTPSTSETSNSGDSEQLEEILKYACEYVGKMGYKGRHYEPLKEGGKVSCSGFVYAVFKEYGLMNIKFSHAGTGSWKKGDIPGTEQVDSLSKASPGDVLWTNTTERTCGNLSW